MAAKRRWKQWPGRTFQELNGLSGIAGLGGIAIGAGGLTFLAGAAAVALTGVGAVIVVGAVSAAIAKGMPPLLKRPEELVGEIVDISDLSNVSPAIIKLSIIGPSQTGKDDLKKWAIV